MENGELNINKLLSSGGENTRNNTRPITFGAILAVILSLLFLAQQTLPFIGTIALFLCPIPVILMQIAFRNVKYTTLLILVSAFIISGITSPLWGIMFFILFGLPNLIMAIFITKGVEPLTTVIITGLVATIATGFVMYGSFSMLEEGKFESIIAKQKKDISYFLDEQIKVIREKDPASEEIGKMEDLKKMILLNFKMFYVIFPAFILCSTIFFTGINYQVSKFVLRRMRIGIKSFPPFEKWELSRFSVWILVTGYLLSSFTDSENSTFRFLGYAGVNLFLTSVAFYFLFGLALFHHFTKKMEMSKPVRIVSYVFIALNVIPLTPIFAMGGLFDQIFDIRKLNMEEPDEDNKNNENNLNTDEKTDEKEDSYESNNDF